MLYRTQKRKERVAVVYFKEKVFKISNIPTAEIKRVMEIPSRSCENLQKPDFILNLVYEGEGLGPQSLFRTHFCKLNGVLTYFYGIMTSK